MRSRGEHLVDSVKNNLTAPTKFSEFVRTCGTQYVHAIYYGHQIDESYQFHFDESGKKRSDNSSFSLGVSNLFDFNFSEKAGSTNFGSTIKVNSSSASRGIPANVPAPASGDDASGIPNLAKYARFQYLPAVQAAAPEAARPVLIELVSYRDLPDPEASHMPEWPEEIRDAIATQSGPYMQFLTILGDLERAANMAENDQKEFYVNNKADIADKYKQALALQNRFRDSIRACHELLNSEAEPSNMSKCSIDGFQKIMDPIVLLNLKLEPKAIPKNP